MTITGAQVKAARQLLGWPQYRVAAELGVSQTAIARFELGKGRLSALQTSVLKRALESAGVEFTNGGEPGVKIKPLERRSFDSRGSGFFARPGALGTDSTPIGPRSERLRRALSFRARSFAPGVKLRQVNPSDL
jgi:transcriptional regulator with XRE-family HTH domain